MESQKKKILLIPGWWPCQFFMDPSMLLSDIYDTYVLHGECIPLPLKQIQKYTKCCIKATNEREVQVQMCWLRYKTRWAHKYQHTRLVNVIDQAVKALMGNELPNVVSIQSLSSLAPFVVDWAHQNGIKVIMTEHQLHFRILADPFPALMYSVYGKVDKLLCVSNYLYRNLLINEFGIDKATVIGNLVDDVNLDTQKLAIKKDCNRIIFVAGHPHSKDLHILFEVASLLQVDTNYEIDIVGMSEQQICLDGKTIGYHIKEKNLYNLRCLGKHAHDELLQIYPNYAMLLSTSRSETFGISVAEAILNGLPVVCTDNGGCHEFVHDTNGVIANIRDPRSICEAVLQVMQNIKDGKYNPLEMSSEIRNKYGRKAYRERILPIYEQYAN